MSNSAWIPVRVTRKQTEAEGIISIELKHATGGELPAFEPGAHVDVELPVGLVRQYSLCGSPAERQHYILGILREEKSRGGSQAMHDCVAEGDVIRISAPRNHFPLAESAPYSLLLGGGIGVTPILAMAEQLSLAGAAFEMHYCTRSAARTAFAPRLLDSAFANKVHFHHDEGPEEQKLALPALIHQLPPRSHLYVCGPSGFMDWVISTAREQGWPEERIHREYFSNDVTTRTDDGGFDVVLAQSNRKIRVAADQSVVAALAAAGVLVPMSCEQGVCGTCLTRVIEGIPDHRDMFLTADEQSKGDQFTPCCSRAKSDVLVLDL